MNPKSKAQLESYEQDCGLLRVQAVNQASTCWTLSMHYLVLLVARRLSIGR